MGEDNDLLGNLIWVATSSDDDGVSEGSVVGGHDPFVNEISVVVEPVLIDTSLCDAPGPKDDDRVLIHTAISLWIAAGANPKQIAVRAGHTSVSVVLDRYGHLFPQHDDALLQALEYSPPSSTAAK